MFVVLSTKSLCLKRVQPYSPVPHTSVAFCASLYIAGTRWTIFIWSLLTGSVMIRNVWGKDSFWRELCLYCTLLCVMPLQCSALGASWASISGSHLSSQIVNAFESGTLLHLPLSLSRRYLARVFSRDIVQWVCGDGTNICYPDGRVRRV